MKKTQNKLCNTLFVYLIVIVCIVASSCTKTTENKDGHLSGWVNLVKEEELRSETADYSGVVVALYNLVKLDEAVLKVNADYPGVGVQINQRTEFDHRHHNPIKETETGSGGQFNIANIPVGKYNLVVLKQGWGSRYVFEIEIELGNNTLDETVQLYEETVLFGTITDKVEMLPYHHYVFHDNTTFITGSEVIIHPESVIRIGAGKTVLLRDNKLSVRSNRGEYFEITSNDSYCYAKKSEAILPYYSLRISDDVDIENDMIANARITHGNYGLIIQNSRTQLSNLIVNGETAALQVVDDEYHVATITVNIENSLFRGNLLDGQSLINLYMVLNATIKNNVIIGDQIGVILRQVTEANVKNNYILDNEIGIRCFNRSSALIENNVIEGHKAIENYKDSSVFCYKNEINATIGIENALKASGTDGFANRAYITANDNNLHCSEYTFKTRALFNTSQLVNLNVKDNYWGTTDKEQIEKLIWDRKNEDESDSSYDKFMAVFDYNPFRNRRVEDAGILDEE